MSERFWWLGEVDTHGVARPYDGPHKDVEGVKRALKLIRRMRWCDSKEKKFCFLECIQHPLEEENEA